MIYDIDIPIHDITHEENDIYKSNIPFVVKDEIPENIQMLKLLKKARICRTCYSYPRFRTIFGTSLEERFGFDKYKIILAFGCKYISGINQITGVSSCVEGEDRPCQSRLNHAKRKLMNKYGIHMIDIWNHYQEKQDHTIKKLIKYII